MTTYKTPYQGRDATDVDADRVFHFPVYDDNSIKCSHPNISCTLITSGECGMSDKCTACIPRDMSCNAKTCKLHSEVKICNDTIACEEGPCETSSGLDFATIGILVVVIVILLIVLIIVIIKYRRRVESHGTDDQVSFNAPSKNVEFNETNEYYGEGRNASANEHYYGQSDGKYDVNISVRNEYYGE